MYNLQRKREGNSARGRRGSFDCGQNTCGEKARKDKDVGLARLLLHKLDGPNSLLLCCNNSVGLRSACEEVHLREIILLQHLYFQVQQILVVF